MKCMDPILCYELLNKRRYVNFSLASPIAKLTHGLVFDCGKCIICRKKRSRELAMRCVLHASLSTQNCFLTLTYDENQEGYHNNLDYTEIQKFKKRLQTHCRYHFKKQIKIFNVHEYGKAGKKHWHLVVFNHDFDDKKLFTVRNGNNLYTSEKLKKLWPHGFSTIGDVTEASALYQAQYTQKDFINGNANNDKKSKSNHSGIGKPYFLKHYSQILRLGYVPFNGQKIPVPRYFLKLAHRHYSHFYVPSNFLDFSYRKKIHRPFKKDKPNKDLADCYALFEKSRNEIINEKTKEWNDKIKPFLFNKEKPDFRMSGENFQYDLNKRKQQGEF